MWSHFEGKARTLQESIAYLATLKYTDWKVQGITLHNTSAPNLKQWVESGAAHDARIRNLQSYYEGMGWHAGPHWFISRNFINWFSNPLLPGVHSRCWNSTRFGIEMVGDYGSESFSDGDGALVRDLALQWVAVLNKRFGFRAEDIVFHVECKQDNHDCPGKHVTKPDVIARVKSYMGQQPVVTPPKIPPSVPPPGQSAGKRTGRTTVGNLNVREAAGALNPIQARLGVNEQVTIVNEAMNGDTKWYEIERPHSSTGWVAAVYIKLD